MQAIEIIAKKRDGKALSPEEINFFVQGITTGDIPDYQAAAFLMAVYLKGMTKKETASLTLAMARSGKMLDLKEIAPFVVDKHSTGGVGDKTTLVVAPLVAATGLFVGKMTGRGLAFTGGTVDKLESIPGFNATLSTEQFLELLAKHKIAVTGQTEDLAPADKAIYAIRDVTATVECIPLIASSIMSKKIASGANAIVLDVKVGKGAFMKSLEKAVALAKAMVEIGESLGKKVVAVISDMNQPLGRAIGNALEVIEAIETLRGFGPPDFLEHCLVVASQMLLLGGYAKDAKEARKKLIYLIESGKALEKFEEWVKAQGGDARVTSDTSLLPSAKMVEEIESPRSGYISQIDAQEVGIASMQLGAGRMKKEEEIDPAVGVILYKKIGDYVKKKEPLLEIHANDEERLAQAKERLLAAYDWSNEPVPPPPPIYQVIGKISNKQQIK